jgi:hypothetical protein
MDRIPLRTVFRPPRVPPPPPVAPERDLTYDSLSVRIRTIWAPGPCQTGTDESCTKEFAQRNWNLTA